MRWCPQCGRPKELHKKPKGFSSARLPKDPAPHLRECVLELVDLAGKEEDVHVYRAASDGG